MKALLIVDLQNDFLPGGALPVPKGNNIIPEINRIMDMFDVVIASMDWHPENSIHFERWRPHCVRDTQGAAFPAELDTTKIQKVFLKGTGNQDDGYSAFEATSSNLDTYLKAKNIILLYLAGIATEYCVKSTAMDAVKKGYQTFVIKNVIAGMNANPGDEEKAYRDMKKTGIKTINTRALKSELP